LAVHAGEGAFLGDCHAIQGGTTAIEGRFSPCHRRRRPEASSSVLIPARQEVIGLLRAHERDLIPDRPDRAAAELGLY
jgi:hypothetical protein